MISKNFFVKTIQNIKDIHQFSNELANAVGAYEMKIDFYLENLVNSLIEEVQDYIDEDTETNIDMGEILSIYLFEDTPRNKNYLVKIDNEEFTPQSPGELYNLIITIKERFSDAENIDYATTM